MLYPTLPRDPDAATIFAGDSEMAARCRTFDWAASPLGPLGGWPAALRTAAQLVVAAGLPNIVLWGPGLIQIYNDSYARIIHAKHPLALGRGNQEVWPEVWHLNGPIYERVFAGDTVTLTDTHYPLERENAEGGWALEEAYLTISFSPIRDDAGSVAGVLANMLETTTRVREQERAAARAAEEERQRFRIALGDGLRPLANPEHIQREAARVLGEHLGVQRAFYTEIEGSGTEAVYVFVGHYAHDVPSLPPGRYPVAAFGQALWSPLTNGLVVRVEDTDADPRFDASERAAYRDASIRGHVAVPLIKDGRLVALFGVHSAVPRTWVEDEVALIAETAERTWAAVERARAEVALAVERERLRAVVLKTPAPLALLEGAPLRFTLVNAAYARVSGDTRDVTGLTPAEAFVEAPDHELPRVFERVSSTGEPWIGHERLVTHDADGTGVVDSWFDLRVEPIYDGAGRITGVFNFAVDITDQVRARREVERLLAESEVARDEAEAARVEAEAANRTKSEFLTLMSHELRTPLNAIGGYAALIEAGIRGPVTPEQAHDLARIQQSQRHLLGLINGVLNYARIEAGVVHYAIEDVSLSEIFATSVALIAPQARARNHRLTCTGCDTTLRVRADREKLQQIVINLLSNAVKFTEPGGEVTMSCDVESAAFVNVLVRDTGIGIAPEQIARVFEPFVQVDAKLTRTREGTGLGLAISRDLARGMGGELSLESEVAVGSVFTLTLPRS